MAAGLARVAGGWIDPGTDLSALGWSALMAAPVGIGAALSDGRLLFANDALVEALGFPVEQLVEKGWIACLYPDPEEQRATLALVDDISRRAGVVHHHRQVMRGDGGTRVLDLTSSGFELPDGRRGSITTAVDVTDMWIPIGSVRRGMREMVDDAPDVLWRIDVKTRRVLFVSKGLERMLGFAPEELYRDPFLLRAQFIPEHLARYQETLALACNGTAGSIVVAIRRRDGATLLVHQAFYPVRDASGRVVVVEGLARDITAVRELEQRLEETIVELRARNEELASLDRLKSQLLANVSHELRTPLVTIKGYTELILRGSLGPLTARQRRGLEISGANTERLIELIETLLEFARRQEGRLALHLTRLDARIPVREAVGQLAERIAARGIRLTVDVGNEPLEIDGDHQRLVQLMKVLVSNAEKFCEGPDGAIRVVARRDQQSGKPGDILLEVYDTGIGIPVAARQKIFERFYQVDASSTRRFGGTGLGLALAREIATLHGGEIVVDSAEGLGSTFAVRLPPSESLAVERARHEQPVLLIGAGEEGWRALRGPLEAAGFGLLHAESAADTARRAHRHRPDAVVLVLPPAAVAEAVDGLRREPETASIPVVAVVASDARAALASRIDLVVDPAERATLPTVLGRLLGEGDAAATGRRPRVVIVDDEPENLDFTRFVLEREGCDVVSFSSGELALAAIDDSADLVILDLAMDGIDGIEVCRRLKEQPTTRRVPILVVTAMTGEQIRRDSFASGANGFLVKPFALSELMRQVRLHLRADRPREGAARKALAGENA